MSITNEEIKKRYPIHWLVWNNEVEELQTALDSEQFTPEDLELKDPRGRTPLLLAVTLGYTDVVEALLDAGADVNCEKDGWTAVQEATATGDAELLSIVLTHRDQHRNEMRAKGVPELLQKLSLAPDFYVEMKWEFTSWVPLVSRMCPFDTYRVYKRGANVRVDTTLIGFENNTWQRGDRSYIFSGHGASASLVELDHLSRTWCGEEVSAAPAAPRAAALRARLAAPLAINYLDTDKISFERNKSGIWGWRQDKTEAVNGYECKVFGASNVELVSKTRTEHVRTSAGRSTSRVPLAGLLALADETTNEHSEEEQTPTEELPPPYSAEVSLDEYFGEGPLRRDVGRPRQEATKVQKFKATLWLCEDYPLQLQEQIMPILDLMASMSSPHFAKLKDFIQMQLPAGFPVKIEIPLFHVLNARITFGNIFSLSAPAPHVSAHPPAGCSIAEDAFHVPEGYRDATEADDRHLLMDDEESLLQYAIQQSLMEAGTHDDQVDVWEALRGARPSTPSPTLDSNLLSHEERQLQSAIEASLATSPSESPPAIQTLTIDNELQRALKLSALEHSRLESEIKAEQSALDEAIRLSLLDK